MSPLASWLLFGSLYLILITAVFSMFAQADRRQERRRSMQRHPSSGQAPPLPALPPCDHGHAWVFCSRCSRDLEVELAALLRDAP